MADRTGERTTSKLHGFTTSLAIASCYLMIESVTLSIPMDLTPLAAYTSDLNNKVSFTHKKPS